MATGWGRRVRVDVFTRSATNQTPTGLPTTFAASLHTGNPGDDGQTVNEVSQTTSGYLRQSFTFSAPTAFGSLTVDTASVGSNSGTITFGPSAGATPVWGVITYVGIWTATGTALTESTYLGRALVSVSQNVAGAGVTLTIAGGGLTLGTVSA